MFRMLPASCLQLLEAPEPCAQLDIEWKSYFKETAEPFLGKGSPFPPVPLKVTLLGQFVFRLVLQTQGRITEH